MKCPQLSKPEATAARNQNSISDRMEKKTLGETRLSWGPFLLWPDDPAVQFQLLQSQIVRAQLVPVVFSLWLSRWRGPHWGSGTNKGPSWSRREGGAWQSQRDGAAEGVESKRRRMVDDWPRRPWWSRWVDGPRRSPALRGRRSRQGILQPRRWWRLADLRRSHHTDRGLRVSWGTPEDSGGDGEDWCRCGGRGRLGGSSGWSGGLETGPLTDPWAPVTGERPPWSL